MNNIAIFRGEEKGPESVDNPIEELKDKLNWSYSGYNYLCDYEPN
jgi:hypothetical protein